MAKVTNFRVHGDAILNRLGQTKPKAADAVPVPAGLLPALQNFAKVHDKYSDACAKADKGREKRDKALDAVGAADGKLCAHRPQTDPPIAVKLIHSGRLPHIAAQDRGWRSGDAQDGSSDGSAGQSRA